MSGVAAAGSVRILLAGPAVARTFGFALVGRLAYGVLPLCFLFTARQATGSFALAATSTAVLGLSTLAMPIQARLVDRFGQRRVLPFYTALFVAFLLTTATLAQGSPSEAVWLGFTLALGLSAPALGPAMRAQWREITADGPARRRAYSIDSIGEESLYLVGPLVAGVVLAVGPPWVGLLLASLLVSCGATALVVSPYQPPPVGSSGPSSRRSSRRRRTPVVRPLLALLVVLALYGAGGAAAFVGIAGLADRMGNPAVAAPVEAAMAAGAVVGGLLWARHGSGTPSGPVLAAILTVLAVGQGLTAAVTPELVAMGAMLALGALATSPAFVVAFSLADSIVAAPRRTEASTWVTVSANLGNSVGTAGAGAVTAVGAPAPFVTAALLTSLAAILSVSIVRQ